MTNVVSLKWPEGRAVPEVQDSDLAARIGRGEVPFAEIERMSAFASFSDWLERQGFKVLKRGRVAPQTEGTRDE